MRKKENVQQKNNVLSSCKKKINCLFRHDFTFPKIFVRFNQKADSFWGRINNGYNNYHKPFVAREWYTLKSRWHLLDKHCQWFCRNYKLVVANKKSGHSKTDVIDEIRNFFVQVCHQRFTMGHAWRLLKDEPKLKEIKFEWDPNVPNPEWDKI